MLNVCGGHPRLRRLREVRNYQEGDASVLALKSQRLPDCHQARRRAVDAAEDPVEELGLARLCVHPRGLGCRSGVDDVLQPEERTNAAFESRLACFMLISAPWRVRGRVSRMELDRALEAEAERRRVLEEALIWRGFTVGPCWTRTSDLGIKRP